MHLTPVARALVASSILLPAGASASYAQVIRGTVADSATARLLDACWVSLISSDGHIVDRVVTDSSGQFALSAPAPGSHVVQIERLGYGTVRTEPFALGARAEISLSLFLPPDAVGLKPVTVTAAPDAAARYLERSGYFERKRTSQGVYLDGADLEERRKRARDFADVLRAIPGVSTIALGGGSSLDNRAFRLRGMESIARACRMPLVYLDGMVVAANDPGTSWGQLVRELNGVIYPEHLLAIEVYRGPSEVPTQYSGADSGCGVILIWTRHSSR
jgi:hypothetical protein